MTNFVTIKVDLVCYFIIEQYYHFIDIDLDLDFVSKKTNYHRFNYDEVK